MKGRGAPGSKQWGIQHKGEMIRNQNLASWRWWTCHENVPLTKDVLHPSQEKEKRKHQKKRLMQSPNSYLMDVGCPGCYKVTHDFSHTQTVVLLLVSLLSSDSLQEEKQGFQKDAPSDRSNTESTLHQNEWETIPINTFWIYIYI